MTTTSRNIRFDLDRHLRAIGYLPTSGTYETIGADKGARVHRSFASRLDSVEYSARQGAACRLAVSSVSLRTLYQRQLTDEPGSSYAVDSEIDGLVDSLESWTGAGYAVRVDSATAEPLPAVSTIELITITMTVTSHQYRE